MHDLPKKHKSPFYILYIYVCVCVYYHTIHIQVLQVFPLSCVSRWWSHLSDGGSVVISLMKWDSCRLTSWSRSHTSITLCSIKLQRYKLTSVTSKHLSSSPSPDIHVSVSASCCSTDIPHSAQPVRHDLWPQPRSAPQHDRRNMSWGYRKRYKHINGWLLAHQPKQLTSHLFNISINQRFLLDRSETDIWCLQAACAHIDSLVVCQWCRWMTSYCTAWPAARICLLDWRFTVRQTRPCRWISIHHRQRWKTGCGRKASVNRESLYDSNQWTINDNNPPVTPHITGAGKNEIPL